MKIFKLLFSYTLLMKKKDYIILSILLVVFTLLFKHNNLVRDSVIDSSKIWFYNIVTSLLPIYIITDLLINYGIINLFKNNKLFLTFISLLLGSPSNAKYIKEFYLDNYISLEEANNLLIFSYSPSPLFILNISPSIKYGLFILLYIYFTNFILFLFTKKKNNTFKTIGFKKMSFSKCIESSINKSFKILILILGVIIIYNIIISLLDIMFVDKMFFIKTILELTNGLNITTKLGSHFLIYSILISTFGGLSIHTQIKSILEDSNISYYCFLKGRLLSLMPLIPIIIFY